jgi:NCS1 family nucleobase:cation symporter-1
MAFEEHHVDPVPAGDRHGRPWQQGLFWAGANFDPVNVVLGGVVVSLGLPFGVALAVIVAGTCAGAAVIGLLATAGPKLGVPQMIQSRAPFGITGASLLSVAVLVLAVGYIAAMLVIQGQSLTLVAGLTVPAWVGICVVPVVAIGVVGHSWVQYVARGTAVLVGLTVVVVFAQAVARGALPAGQGLHAVPIARVSAVAAIPLMNMLSWGPFVSDETRYLPRGASPRRVFVSVTAGAAVATVLSGAAGAYITAALPHTSMFAAIGRISGSWALVIMALSLINGCAIDAYTGALQIVSIMGTFRPLKASARLRALTYLVTVAAGAAVACLGYRSFVTGLSGFLNVLLMIFVPWVTVALADLFVVNKDSYDIAALLDPAGRYRGVAWDGVAAYAAGLAAEVPFINQALWQGWWVHAVGGADISWVAGIVASSAVYLGLAPYCGPGRPPAAGAGRRRAACGRGQTAPGRAFMQYDVRTGRFRLRS